MEANDTQFSKDHRRTALQLAMVLFSALWQSGNISVIAALVIVICSGSEVLAQKAEIRSADRDQDLIHDLRSQSQSFPEVRWDVHNTADPRGTVVIWSIEPFESNGGRNRKTADAAVSLRVLSSNPSRAWQVAQAADRTDVVRGDQSATVSAVCSGFGQATLGLSVSFHSIATIPAAGRYRTRLVGTMTAP